jgi:hypothetical protein
VLEQHIPEAPMAEAAKLTCHLAAQFTNFNIGASKICVLRGGAHLLLVPSIHSSLL